MTHTKQCASGSVVEHLLAKEGVAGSIPVSRFFFCNKNGYLNRCPFLLQNRAQSRARRFDFSASASVVASLLRKEVSTGHPQPVSRFFCLFLRNLVVLVLFMLHFVLHKRVQSRARRFDFSASASVVASLLRKEVSTGHPQPVSRFLPFLRNLVVLVLFMLHFVLHKRVSQGSKVSISRPPRSLLLTSSEVSTRTPATRLVLFNIFRSFLCLYIYIWKS